MSESVPKLFDVETLETKDAFHAPFLEISTYKLTGETPLNIDKLVEPIDVSLKFRFQEIQSNRSLLTSEDIYPKEELLFVEKLIKGKTVTDLGCGVNNSGFIIANYFGASNYIGVEKNFAASTFDNILNYANELGKKTQFSIIQTDILSYLEDPNLQENSQDFMILSGIDYRSIADDDHWFRIIQSLELVLSDEGIVIGLNNTDIKLSDVVQSFLDYKLTKIVLPSGFEYYKK